MVKAVCVNGDLDTAQYGSPMPMIGTYIALATLVCFLSILFDIFYGFYRKTPWLPCKLFSLNSFTLSVVAVAAKLPVDLSTPMPRAADQLSKITGSVLLCISMGVVMPSLGSMRPSECLANMAALTVLIITVIVNIYIQIVTGVIFTFIPEHITLMVCMLVLVVALWSSALTLYRPKKFCNSIYRKAAEDYPSEWSIESMRKQLVKLYGLSYSCNPQLFCCETMNCFFVGIPCVLVAAIASEAIIRSFFVKDLKFCNGVSDYKWSVWWVLVIQILCIMMGSFTVLFRWLIMVGHMSLPNFKSLKHVSIARDFEHDRIQIAEFLLRLHFEYPCKSLRLISITLGTIIWVLLYLMHGSVSMAGVLVAFSCLKVRKSCALMMMMMIGKCTNRVEKEMRSAPEEDLQIEVITLYKDPGMKEWKLRIAADDMKRWIETNKRDPPTHLIHLLSESLTPQQRSHSLLSKIQFEGQKYDCGVSGVTLLFLVTLMVSISSPRAEFLMQCLGESMELIYFIENRMKLKDEDDMLKLEWFQRLWAVRDALVAQMKIKIKRELGATGAPQREEESDLQHALRMIVILSTLEDLDREDFKIICDSITDISYESIEQLYERLEVTFSDMLRMLLADLPRAIFKEYHESFVIEESEERIRNAIKFFVRLGLLGIAVQWSWPTQANVSQVIANIDTSAQEGGQDIETGNANVHEIQEIGPQEQV